MFRSQALRSATRSASRLYASNPTIRPTPKNTSYGVRRRICAAQPAQKRPHGESVSTKPPASETAKRDAVQTDAHVDAAQPGKAPEPSAPAVNPSASTEPASKIPDVPSTSWSSLGFEEEHAKDPNKWKKFAWKYAGAVLLFMISYKSLHWYVDRLEADGKRQRTEMEENKQIVKGILESEKNSAPALPGVGGAQQQIPETSSELDELYAYKTELEKKLRDLRLQTRTPEIESEKKDVQLELKELAKEIRALEAKRKD